MTELNDRILGIFKEIKKMSFIDKPNKVQGNYSDLLRRQASILLDERERQVLTEEGWSPLEIIMYQRHSDLAIEEYQESKDKTKKAVNKIVSDAGKLVINSDNTSKIQLYRSAFIVWSVESQPYNDPLLNQKIYTDAVESFERSIFEIVGSSLGDPWFQKELRQRWARFECQGFKIPEVKVTIYTRIMSMLECTEDVKEILTEESLPVEDLGEYLIINEL